MRIAWLALSVLLFPTATFAQAIADKAVAAVQTPPTPVTDVPKFIGYDWQSLMTPLVIVAVPLLVAAFKRIPWVATHKPVLPVFAIVISVVLNFIAVALTDSRIGPLAGTVLGLAGVGLREFYDQMFRRDT